MSSYLKISKDLVPYLSGEEQSNGLYFPVYKKGVDVKDRISLLRELTKSKSVIHMGCADHVNLIESKRKNGTYLHDILIQNCSKVVGIDSDENALKMMKNLGINDLYHVDEFNLSDQFEYMLVTDVIEHINDVGVFLNSLKKYNVKKWIFTTPNAYRLRNRSQFKHELINTDHRYWFSPYTLAKTLFENGYTIERFYMTDSLSFRNPIKSYFKLRYPLCRDGLAFLAYI